MFSFFWLILLWLKETFYGFFRNFFRNFSAIILSTACLFLFAIAFVVGEYGQFIAKDMEKKVEIKVYLHDEVVNYHEIEERIGSVSGVKEVTFSSKEEEKEKIKKELGEDGDMVEVLAINPFAASFSVRLHNPHHVKEISQEIKSWGIAEKIEYGEGYIESLLIFTENANYVAYAMIVVVAVYAAYIVNNAISFNIIQRKNEIRIKQLTGAGNFTIRMPFIMEALIIMLISSSIVYGLFTRGYGELAVSLKKAIPYAPILDSHLLLEALTKPLYLMAIVIGLFGSLISTQRFLKR